MTSFQPARRDFLQLLSGTAGAAWLAANLPAIVVAAEHARQAVRRPNPPLEVLTADQAQELDAITSRLIPTDDVAGAHEAGVVFFIDRALKTFASDSLPEYRKGLTEIQERTTKRFPGVASFSAATPEQQDKILAELFAESENRTRRAASNLPPKSPLLSKPSAFTLFSAIWWIRRAAAIATSWAGKPSAAIPRTCFPLRLVFTRRTIPAGSLRPRKRIRNDPGQSHLQARRGSRLRHRGLRRGRRRARQGTLHQRLQRRRAGTGAVPPRKRFQPRRNEGLYPASPHE